MKKFRRVVSQSYETPSFGSSASTIALHVEKTHIIIHIISSINGHYMWIYCINYVGNLSYDNHHHHFKYIYWPFRRKWMSSMCAFVHCTLGMAAKKKLRENRVLFVFRPKYDPNESTDAGVRINQRFNNIYIHYNRWNIHMR